MPAREDRLDGRGRVLKVDLRQLAGGLEPGLQAWVEALLASVLLRARVTASNLEERRLRLVQPPVHHDHRRVARGGHKAAHEVAAIQLALVVLDRELAAGPQRAHHQVHRPLALQLEDLLLPVEPHDVVHAPQHLAGLHVHPAGPGRERLQLDAHVRRLAILRDGDIGGPDETWQPSAGAPDTGERLGLIRLGHDGVVARRDAGGLEASISAARDGVERHRRPLSAAARIAGGTLLPDVDEGALHAGFLQAGYFSGDGMAGVADEADFGGLSRFEGHSAPVAECPAACVANAQLLRPGQIVDARRHVPQHRFALVRNARLLHAAGHAPPVGHVPRLQFQSELPLGHVSLDVVPQDDGGRLGQLDRGLLPRSGQTDAPDVQGRRGDDHGVLAFTGPGQHEAAVRVGRRLRAREACRLPVRDFHVRRPPKKHAGACDGLALMVDDSAADLHPTLQPHLQVPCLLRRGQRRRGERLRQVTVGQHAAPALLPVGGRPAQCVEAAVHPVPQKARPAAPGELVRLARLGPAPLQREGLDRLARLVVDDPALEPHSPLPLPFAPNGSQRSITQVNRLIGLAAGHGMDDELDREHVGTVRRAVPRHRAGGGVDLDEERPARHAFDAERAAGPHRDALAAVGLAHLGGKEATPGVEPRVCGPDPPKERGGREPESHPDAVPVDLRSHVTGHDDPPDYRPTPAAEHHLRRLPAHDVQLRAQAEQSARGRPVLVPEHMGMQFHGAGPDILEHETPFGIRARPAPVPDLRVIRWQHERHFHARVGLAAEHQPALDAARLDGVLAGTGQRGIGRHLASHFCNGKLDGLLAPLPLQPAVDPLEHARDTDELLAWRVGGRPQHHAHRLHAALQQVFHPLLESRQVQSPGVQHDLQPVRL